MQRIGNARDPMSPPESVEFDRRRRAEARLLRVTFDVDAMKVEIAF